MASRRIIGFLNDPRAVTLGALGVVAASLWWMMLSMGSMAMPTGWSPGVVVSTAIMWVLMMLAMMLPAMAPVLAVYAGLAAKEDRGVRLAARILLFFAGYFALWAAVSILLALLQLWLRDSPYFSTGGTQAAPVAAGVLMVAAGVYQMTGIKDACLRHCRSPLAFLLAHWREGLAGAFPVGFRHGAYCVGCCVAFMGLMFVFGAMNPWWMAVIAAYFVAEKLAPAAELWSRWTGVALIAAGAATVAVSQASAKEAVAACEDFEAAALAELNANRLICQDLFFEKTE